MVLAINSGALKRSSLESNTATHGRQSQPRSQRHAVVPRASFQPAVALAFAVAGIDTDSLLANPAAALIPLAIGGAIAVGAAKAAAYSQLEVVRAAMLSRHVKPGGARVLQFGGTTKDLFYYPSGTVEVKVAGPDIKVSLWETAGMNAGVPVKTIQADLEQALKSQAGSTVDSVVVLDQLGQVSDIKAFVKEVRRVLKPGGTFVFVQRLVGSPVASLIRLGGPAAIESSVADSIAGLADWDFIQWDTASESLDPHAAGVAIKSLQAVDKGDYSADKAVFEQVMKKKKTRVKKSGAKTGFQ